MDPQPLILTLSLNKEALDFFTNLRAKHFPPERNFLPAHLTLFHQLPGQEKAIKEVLAETCRQRQPFSLTVAGLMNLGNGVAYKIESKDLQQLHQSLQHQWQAFLIPQDKQKLRPHITIQNKVKPEEAKALENDLKETFRPFAVTGTGLTLWRYLGGPWAFYQEYGFSAGTPLSE